MHASPPESGDLEALVRRALEEDAGRGDLTTDALIDETTRAVGRMTMKADGVVAGLGLAVLTFHLIEPGVEVPARRRDGEWCPAGTVVLEVHGRARTLLTGERTALNFVQRLSGIATLTRRFVERSGGRLTILDTRKTTPTLRRVEKEAVRAGGGTNHRFALDDGVLIKDNHLALVGSIDRAVGRLRRAAPEATVEVEVSTLDEVEEALAAGADVLLLDNMPTAVIREAVARCRGRARTEVSGGVTLERVDEIASTGADAVSVGALTHSAPAVDVSFSVADR